MLLGQGNYLICNNTRESMDSITKNPRWLNAQVAVRGIGGENPRESVADFLGHKILQTKPHVSLSAETDPFHSEKNG